MKHKFFILIFLLLTLGNKIQLKADQRNFVWSYQYSSMPKNELEIENYNTIISPQSGKHLKNSTIEQEIEIEYGLTDHWDIAFYHMYRQKPGRSFKYRGYKLRTRYRIGEEGVYFVDPVIYLEWIQKDHEVELEEKIILGKKTLILFNTFYLNKMKKIKPKEFE